MDIVINAPKFQIQRMIARPSPHFLGRDGDQDFCLVL